MRHSWKSSGLWRDGNQAGDRSSESSIRYVEQDYRKRTCGNFAKVVRPGDGESGRFGAVDDAGAGQAAGGIKRRSCLRGIFPGMVWGRSEADLRRYDSAASTR